MLRPGQAVALTVRRAFDFEGRSRRSEYWWSNLFFVLFFSFGTLIDTIFFSNEYPEDYFAPGTYGFFASWRVEFTVWPFTNIFFLLGFVPILAVGIRRMHDVNRSGWWFAIPTVLYAFQTANVSMGDPGTGNGGLIFVWLIFLLFIGVTVFMSLYFSIKDSDYVVNDFGPPVKERPA